MQRSGLLSFVFASLYVASSLGVTITDHSQLPGLTYDYIIVGAGNAGLVVANRLTEDPSVTVLVLEAGVSDQGVIAAEAPFLGPTLTPGTLYDWNYTLVPQVGMNGRTFPYPRGKLLGGSSSANYLFHQYGSFEDWNRFSSVTSDEGWSWSNMRQYIQRHEKVVPPVDGHNTTGQFIPSLHGFNGEVLTSLPGFNQSIDPRVIATTKQLAEFPFNEDMSGGDQSLLGIGWLQSSAGNGSRSSSSTSYLANANTRPNLTVLINATVMKLLQTGTSAAGLKSFRTVQFARSPIATAALAATGPIVTVTAKNEVILSAGSIGTTQILQLSGIGNSADLAKLNIPVAINNPSVGANLMDHTLLPNIFEVSGTTSFDDILRNATAVGDVLDQWVEDKTGLFANNVANNYGFVRLPANATIFQNTTDPAAGPNSPHWEIIFANFWFNPGISTPSTGHFMTVVAVLVSPTSRGSIKLASSNPFEAPIIDPRFLTTPFDIAAMVESVQAIERFVGAPAWSDYVIGPYGTGFSAAKDEASIESYVRGLTTTIFHPVGTASMASENSTTGVVNPDLTVKGTAGLRIVDASVFPFIPSCHPQGPVYLLAERASDLIKEAAA